MKEIVKSAIVLVVLISTCIPAIGSDGIYVSLTWQTKYADLDLFLINPDGDQCFWNNAQTSWGATLDYDSWGGNRQSDPYPYQEHITIQWDELSQLPGIYTIAVRYYEWGDDPASVPFNIEIRYRNEVIYSDTLTITPGQFIGILDANVGSNSNQFTYELKDLYDPSKNAVRITLTDDNNSNTKLLIENVAQAPYTLLEGNPP
jgi:hypothetical protein